MSKTAKRAIMLVLGMSLAGCITQPDERLCFDTKDTGAPSAAIPLVAPWKVVTLDTRYGGLWYVAGNLDDDAAPEIVSAENFNEGDVHYTSAVAAQKLDGTLLWTWGDPDIGRKGLHHDVACQIQDWDGDGRNEVVVATKGALVELDGKTGVERIRIPIRDDAADSIVFCNFSGGKHADIALVKDRYNTIWAYRRNGQLLWSVTKPGGYKTAHQPRPMDLDGDGVDEILAGYAMLNADGSVRWIIQSETIKKRLGHLDCARVVRSGAAPEDIRIAATFCGGKNLALLDGNGRVVWEMGGHHFESVQAANIMPGKTTPQLLVDVDHQPSGASPIWVVSFDGRVLGKLITDYSRQHRPIDWDGDGLDEFVVAAGRGLYDHTGQRVATFDLPAGGGIVHTGDMDGDGRDDVIFGTEDKVWIFRNESFAKPAGTGCNVTLY